MLSLLPHRKEQPLPADCPPHVGAQRLDFFGLAWRDMGRNRRLGLKCRDGGPLPAYLPPPLPARPLRSCAPCAPSPDALHRAPPARARSRSGCAVSVKLAMIASYAEKISLQRSSSAPGAFSKAVLRFSPYMFLSFGSSTRKQAHPASRARMPLASQIAVWLPVAVMLIPPSHELTKLPN